MERFRKVGMRLFDGEGLVTKLTVFVRPLSGALALAEAMKRALAGRATG